MSTHDVPTRAKVQRAVLLSLLGGLMAGVTLFSGPSRFGFSDRVERHLFPEVTTGPAEPTWSPDGSRIAFSMQGDIWTMAVAGESAGAEAGRAVAITEGPWYYFEPSWSPDGQWIAFTVDTGGNLDIGMVRADGSDLERLTEHDAVDIEPVWSHDGADLFFVSSRARGFDIFRLHVADRTVTPVVTGTGDQIQPAVSPDGRTLAWVSPVRGRLGTGGIWTRPLDDLTAEPTLVRYEESEYRMRPQWTADGQAFLYGTDEAGSNDIAVVPASGGNPVIITNDSMGEFSPAVAPDGRSFAFIVEPRRADGALHRGHWRRSVLVMAPGRRAVETGAIRDRAPASPAARRDRPACGCARAACGQRRPGLRP